MNWEILAISKEEITFGIPRSYLARQKSRMIIGSILMTIGGLIFLTLIDFIMIVGILFVIAGFLMFRNSYRRFTNSMILLLTMSRKKKLIKFLLGKSSKTKRFSEVEDVLVVEDNRNRMNQKNRPSKYLKDLKLYKLKINFVDGEFLTLFETLNKLEVPRLVHQAEILKDFFNMEKGKNLSQFIKNYKLPDDIPSVKKIIESLIQRIIDDVHTASVLKDNNHYFRINFRLDRKKVPFWTIFYLTLGITLAFLALNFNPWDGIPLVNFYTNILLAFTLIIMAGLSFNLVYIIYSRNIKDIRFDFKLKKIIYPEFNTGTHNINFFEIEYGKITIFNNLSIFEGATNSFFFRTSINTSESLRDFKKMLEKEKLLKSFAGFDF